MERKSKHGSPLEVLAVFLRLGLSSFGGPVAHLGYFWEEIVVRRKWLGDADYAELVSLCQFLPGPASSHVGIALGLRRAGLAGWVSPRHRPWPLSCSPMGQRVSATWPERAGLDGLKIAAVAVVALAVWGMAGNLCPDRPRATMALAAAIGVLAWPTGWGQLAVIAGAGIIGWRLLRTDRAATDTARQFPVSRGLAVICLVLFAGLLLGLPLLRQAMFVDSVNGPLQLFDSFFRVGSLVFGGGHVALPLLQEQVVTPGWVSNAEFVAGYGAAQAVPGPLFTFSACLGTIIDGSPTGWTGGLFALAAIFLPAFCWSLALRLSGSGCGPRAVLAGLCAASTQWWGCCWPRCTTRCESAPWMGRRTSVWRWRHWRCWPSGSGSPGWRLCCRPWAGRHWRLSSAGRSCLAGGSLTAL